jgi:hypothetical protein
LVILEIINDSLSPIMYWDIVLGIFIGYSADKINVNGD